MANLSLEEILKQITDICIRHGVEHLYLFGSYATDTAVPGSDIDIIIRGGRDISGLREETDRIPTLKKIDIFDYDHCANPHLKEDMDLYGKKIY